MLKCPFGFCITINEIKIQPYIYSEKENIYIKIYKEFILENTLQNLSI